MKKVFVLFGVFLSLVFFGFVSAEDAPVAPATINFVIRSGGDIIFSGAVPLPTEGMADLNDQGGISHSVNKRSVLFVLNDADLSSPDFSISNLEYYSSFDSLYLKCITGTVTGEKCDNWQYTVNNAYPGIGMDQKILSGEESVYLYFGAQYRVSFSPNEITTANRLTVAAEEYNYEENSWGARSGVTVGLTQTNPDDPWSPIEVQTSAVNDAGEAIFSSIPAGSYSVGVKEDFYFPTESLNVTNPPAPFVSSGGSAIGGGSLYIPPPAEKIKFDINKAFEFIISEQRENGSFGEDLYTDWIALALASGNYQEEVIKLIKYLGESKMESLILTDYERRAMALMALGLNPYGTNGINYIGKIVSGFDGAQFGDALLVNDDIFALIVLERAGYSKDENIISNVINYILSKQKENGSWEDSVDMTAASLQALHPFFENEQVKSSLTKAKDFLKQRQGDTGGWDNVSSTAWAIGAILALNEKSEDWNKNGNTPLDFLAASQDADGGVKNELMQHRLWETAYAVTALSSKDWNQIMQKFDKREESSKEKEEKTEVAKSVKEKTKKPVKNTAKVQLPAKTKNAKLENIAGQNTAIAINAVNDGEAELKTERNKKWIWRFLEKIFGL